MKGRGTSENVNKISTCLHRVVVSQRFLGNQLTEFCMNGGLLCHRRNRRPRGHGSGTPGSSCSYVSAFYQSCSGQNELIRGSGSENETVYHVCGLCRLAYHVKKSGEETEIFAGYRRGSSEYGNRSLGTPGKKQRP
jgi:hypothetical protein